MPSELYGFELERFDGHCISAGEFRGQVLLIVNTASRCVFTQQYRGLQQLQEKFGGRGFNVLAFPCNQFGAQEPGTANEIASFCQMNFAVSFPVFAKVDVNGPSVHPLFHYLKSHKPGFFGRSEISWNFTKFLVDRKGTVQARFAPLTSPARVAGRIASLLD